MKNRPAIKQYRALELQRLECLRKHQGEDSEEEEAILDLMDDAWWEMSEEEQDHAREPGPHHKETVELIDKSRGWTYEDTWSLRKPSVGEIDRREFETLFSFGHYDGVGTGLVRWKDRLWYASRFEVHDSRYWVVELTPDQQDYALRYGETWAEYFHGGMSWTPGGSPAPRTEGRYAIRPHPNLLTYTDEGREAFKNLFPVRPEPSEDSRVVGYFNGWRIS